MIEVTEQPIDVAGVIASIASPGVGAVVPFIGTVRDDHGISGLAYEGYTAMVRRQLERLAEMARSRWPVEKISIVHRLGWVPVGEASVVIAVAAAHRVEAFAACRFIIEKIKKEVPIWKGKGNYEKAC